MELAELHVLVTALDGAIARLAEGFATDGSPSSGDGGVAGVGEGVSGWTHAAKEDSSEVGTADLLLPNFILMYAGSAPRPLVQAPRVSDPGGGGGREAGARDGFLIKDLVFLLLSPFGTVHCWTPVWCLITSSRG